MQYFYEALDSSGQIVVGKIEGNTVEEVRTRLAERGYHPRSLAVDANSQQPAQSLAPPQNLPIATVAQRQGGVTLAGNAARYAKQSRVAPQVKTTFSPPTQANTGSNLGGVSDKDLLLFFQQIAALVRSGMTLFTALDNLGARTQNPVLRKLVQEMASFAQRGGRVSDVMAQYPRIFPEHSVGMVRAGELGGFVEISLEEIALDYEQKMAINKWTWLPKRMITLSYFALPFGIPLFGTLFSSLDIAANLKLYLSQVLLIYLPLFTALYAGVIVAYYNIQNPKWRHFRDKMVLSLPPFGTLQRQVALGNFVRMLRRLYRAGVAPIHAWDGAMQTANNVHIRESLASSYLMMQQGATMGEAFAHTRLFDNSIEQLIITGEQSGELDVMLDRAAEQYQNAMQESTNHVRNGIARIGRLGMLVLGGVLLCWLAFSYFRAVLNIPKMVFPELE